MEDVIQRFAGWTKESIEYLVIHHPTTRVVDMVKHLGSTERTVYEKLRDLKLLKIRIKTKTTNEKYEAEKAVPWPRINTDMATALKGRGFGHDTTAPGTKNPVYVRQRWVGDIGEAKSSMAGI